MGRLQNDAFVYFPLDCNFFQNKKIRFLINKFGADGPYLYLYILGNTFGDKGYYLIEDEDFKDSAQADLNITYEKYQLIMKYLVDRSMVVKLANTPVATVNVIVGHNIQLQFCELSKNRGKNRTVNVLKELWLLKNENTPTFINVVKNENSFQNNAIKTESIPIVSETITKSKEKESKLKYIKEECESLRWDFSSFENQYIKFLDDVDVGFIIYVFNHYKDKDLRYATVVISNSIKNNITSIDVFEKANKIPTKKGPLNNFTQDMPDFDKVMESILKKQKGDINDL